MLGGGRGKGDVEFLGRGRLNYRQSHAQLPGCARQIFGVGELQPVTWAARIDQYRNCRGARNQFPEDFYTFTEEISGCGSCKTRYVATWSRQAWDEANSHGIAYSDEYNRNGASCRFQGYGRLRSGGDEHIGTESDHLGD